MTITTANVKKTVNSILADCHERNIPLTVGEFTRGSWQVQLGNARVAFIPTAALLYVIQGMLNVHNYNK